MESAESGSQWGSMDGDKQMLSVKQMWAKYTLFKDEFF